MATAETPQCNAHSMCCSKFLAPASTRPTIYSSHFTRATLHMALLEWHSSPAHARGPPRSAGQKVHSHFQGSRGAPPRNQTSSPSPPTSPLTHFFSHLRSAPHLKEGASGRAKGHFTADITRVAQIRSLAKCHLLSRQMRRNKLHLLPLLLQILHLIVARRYFLQARWRGSNKNPKTCSLYI